MKAQYLRFAPDEEIPALACIRKRKLVKYYTRETLAAVLAVSRLLDGQPADTRTPFYYASADTRLHVATSTVEQLLDYCLNTPEDGLTTSASVEKIKALVAKNASMSK